MTSRRWPGLKEPSLALGCPQLMTTSPGNWNPGQHWTLNYLANNPLGYPIYRDGEGFIPRIPHPRNFLIDPIHRACHIHAHLDLQSSYSPNLSAVYKRLKDLCLNSFQSSWPRIETSCAGPFGCGRRRSAAIDSTTQH